MEAGLRRCTTHSLCKAGVENGATENLPMAIRGCTNPQQAALYSISERGRAFTEESFGSWFRTVCRDAVVSGSAHGLRKAGARRYAEAGAIEAQLNALYARTSGRRESAVYTRAADSAGVARQAPEYPAPSTQVRDAY